VAQADPAKDPVNHGWLILGGGEEATDLYSGAFQSVRVVKDAWYNINLKTLVVGDVAIHVRPATRGSQLASNAILDSGTNSLTLDKNLYASVLAAFKKLNPDLANAVRRAVVPMAGLDFSKWPPLKFVLAGVGGDVTLTVAPDTYLQTDTFKQGEAIAAIFSDHGALGGQSILGLPLMNNYFTVHDRTANGGVGVIKFAPIKRP
jgi:hypothetical protein